ncbi:hypothetical protein FPZ49_06685 [Paenibacillus cremeus]|uniref:Four-carbon acid sugar kinase family protein n=1 Tax=Paenibacillus cremeus TaxID=2163881 RepID=A0A559KFF9_9BACL|nr:hypothetical protein FPZ49_06685 [Paenibacillus cremeus]
MQRLAIIADDLTGASDSGVQFARKGLRTQVVFDWKALDAESAGWDTIVVDTDSRSVPGEAAYGSVRSAAETLKQQKYDWIYKKLDSTLRGNLGQEIDAVMDVFGFEAAVVVPAFPRIGRTTVNGIHYLNGVPIHETEIARDPKTPVPESDIAKLLAGQSKRSAALIELETLRCGMEAVAARIQTALEAMESPLIIIDAEADADMERIGQLVSLYGSRLLWVGSAGLADYLPVQAQGGSGQLNALQPMPEAEGQAMLVAGSISRITREQVAQVNEQPNVAAVELDPIALLTSPEAQASEEERCYRALIDSLGQGLDLSLYAGSSPSQVQSAKELGARSGLDSSSVSNRIADALGRIAGRIVTEYRLAGLVLTGGDTAKAVCRHLGVHGIELVAELEAGIPLGRLLGADRMMAVTKAGAFGNAQSLWRAMTILKGEKDNA